MAVPLDLSRHLLVPVHTLEAAYVSGLAAIKTAVDGFQIAVSDETIWASTKFTGAELSPSQITTTLTEIGLPAEHYQLPSEMVLKMERELPLIVPLKTADTAMRYVVIWRKVGPYWQLSDPVNGRAWLTNDQLQAQLHSQTTKVSSTQIEGRFQSTKSVYRHTLSKQLKGLQLSERLMRLCLDLVKENGEELAKVDAIVRFVTHLVGINSLKRGQSAADALQTLIGTESELLRQQLPAAYWAFQPNSEEPEITDFQGVHIIRLHGRDPAVPKKPRSRFKIPPLDQLLGEPEQLIFSILREGGWVAPTAVASGLFIAGIGLTFEVFLLQGLMQLGQQLNNGNQRAMIMALVILFFVTLVLLLIAIDLIGRQQGRRIEVGLRIAFLEKIPRLPLWFFQRTQVSSLTQRGYTLRSVHALPDLAQKFIQTGFQILFTSIALIIIEPSGSWIVLLLLLFTIAWPYITQPIIGQQSLGLAEETNRLSRVYLDALLGIVPVRVHSAENTVWRRYQTLLVSWVNSNLVYFRFTTITQVIGLLISTSFTVGIVLNYIFQEGEIGSILPVVFWATNIPLLGQRLVDAMQEYLQKRAIVQLLLQPLNIPDAAPLWTHLNVDSPEDANPDGVRLELRDVALAVDDIVILQEINLTIEPGEQVAIVGPSGAGKSTLASLVLGWQAPVAGEVLVDGQPLAGEYVELLRRETAWVDPVVQLWNRTLLYNLWYANQSDLSAPLGEAVEQADLFDVLENLPQGLQTMLGENGRLLSGGQGQRVRLGRAMLQENVRLVVLDEAFRGLDRDKRSALLARARAFWPKATMICITHDVSQTEGFSRVLVIEDGRIAEDDTPENLKNREHSRYQDLLKAEEAVRRTLWASADWKRVHLANGELTIKEGLEPQEAGESDDTSDTT